MLIKKEVKPPSSWINIMKDEYRSCPNCGNKTINIKDIYKGAVCLICHRVVENNIFYPVGLTLTLLFFSVLSFKFEQPFIGIIFTVILIVYSSIYKNIIARFFPLKVVKK